jgi:hypothetical protein
MKQLTEKQWIMTLASLVFCFILAFWNDPAANKGLNKKVKYSSFPNIFAPKARINEDFKKTKGGFQAENRVVSKEVLSQQETIRFDFHDFSSWTKYPLIYFIEHPNHAYKADYKEVLDRKALCIQLLESHKNEIISIAETEYSNPIIVASQWIKIISVQNLLSNGKLKKLQNNPSKENMKAVFDSSLRVLRSSSRKNVHPESVKLLINFVENEIDFDQEYLMAYERN